MPSTSTSTKSNPHFNFVSRAPYELGRLLQQLPDNFSSRAPATPETLLIADAAARHAGNGNDVIMSGLEAIGAAIFSAAENRSFPLDTGHIQSMAALIQHLAVAAQFMQETQYDLEYILRVHEARTLTESTGNREK